MRVNVSPLFAALRRSPTGAVLVVAQIAITLAVLCNAASIVARAVAQIDRPTGLDTHDTFSIVVKGISKRFHIGSAQREDLAYLRNLSGVVAASTTFGMPLTHSGFLTTLGSTAHSAGVPAPFLKADEQTLRTLGVPLLEGRNFRADEIAPYSRPGALQQFAEIIVTKALAQMLFPKGHALGATVYVASSPLTIIGITRNFMGPQLGTPAYDVALFPEMPGKFGSYNLLVRTRPGQRDAILRSAKRHIAAAHPHAVVALTKTLADVHKQMNTGSRNIAIYLTAVTALMLAVCCMGVFGLTAFNVSSRTKQIGVRRAVGARKRDIVMEFVTESALILAAGVGLGSVLALAVGQWLSDHYGEPRLALSYVLAGVVTLWTVGQLAAWQPSRRAASIAPSVATRTV